MKSVAIVGFSKSSRDQVFDSKADEIWSVNWAWQYEMPPLDRLFDMHPRWMLTFKGDKMEDHWAWLQKEHPFPIYMMYEYPEVPNCVVYPIEDVLADQGLPYFTSSISYLLGLAMLERFERIELYGVDMATSTEYAYQKAGTEYLLGVAKGRGIDVYLPDNCQLLRSGLYAYDGGFQVISRQTCEKIRNQYRVQFDEKHEAFMTAKAQWELLRKMAGEERDPERLAKLEEQAKETYMQYLAAKNDVLSIDVAIQVMTHMIDHVDMKAPDLTIENNVSVKV